MQQRVGAIAEVLTVGLPFCAFKVLTGLVLLPAWSPLGWLLVGWGGVDVLFNAANAVSLAAGRGRALAVCATQALATRRLTAASSPRGELGTSIDVFLSFLLVAGMIGLGGLARLSPDGLSAWNYAVVANVLGAGIGRVYSSFRRVA